MKPKKNAQYVLEIITGGLKFTVTHSYSSLPFLFALRQFF